MTQTAADIFRPRAGARVRILQKARKPENQKPTDKAKRQKTKPNGAEAKQRAGGHDNIIQIQGGRTGAT